MKETLTWIAIALVTATYARSRHIKVSSKRLEQSPSAELEVDPRRWRHDGTQPIFGVHPVERHLLETIF
jgi:hypothetical protein